MTESLYNNNGTTPEEITSYQDHLVGEGKKYKDTEVLARSAYEKDHYITQLQRENKELRVDLNGRSNLEQLVSELQKTGTSTSTSTNGGVERHSDSNPALDAGNNVTKEAIAEIVKSLVTESKTQDARESNINRCVTELKKVYGDSYVNKLEETSRKLNLSKKYLDELASTSPEALLQLVGAPAPKVEMTAPRSSITSSLSTSTNSGKKDWAYYQNLRKTNSREYFSVGVQNEIHQRVLAGDLDIPSNN